MSLGEWYLTLYCLGTGASIGLYWLVASTGASLPSPVAGRAPHVLAEVITAAALLAAGIARLAGGLAAEEALTGLGLGLIVYALVGSVGLYREPVMRTVFLVGGLFTAPALIQFLASR